MKKLHAFFYCIGAIGAALEFSFGHNYKVGTIFVVIAAFNLVGLFKS